MTLKQNKGEFDDLKGLPPEQVPYNSKPIPTELKPVEGKEAQKIRFSFGDYLRFVWMYLLKEGQGLLTEEVQAAQKVISWGTVALIVGSAIVLFLLGLWL